MGHTERALHPERSRAQRETKGPLSHCFPKAQVPFPAVQDACRDVGHTCWQGAGAATICEKCNEWVSSVYEIEKALRKGLSAAQ